MGHNGAVSENFDPSQPAPGKLALNPLKFPPEFRQNGKIWDSVGKFLSHPSHG